MKSKSAFQFHYQRSVAMKCATQSQLKRTLTVIVFKAAANKRHFSQCGDLLIMNSKLPSLLFIKCLVTTDEVLVLKVNGICHRASKERQHAEKQWEKQKRKADTGVGNNCEKENARTAQKAFYLIICESF